MKPYLRAEILRRLQMRAAELERAAKDHLCAGASTDARALDLAAADYREAIAELELGAGAEVAA